MILELQNLELFYESRKLVPARVWRANRRITDYQWRFNETAAEAVREALEATKEARREWDAKHATKKTKK